MDTAPFYFRGQNLYKILIFLLYVFLKNYGIIVLLTLDQH